MMPFLKIHPCVSLLITIFLLASVFVDLLSQDRTVKCAVIEYLQSGSVKVTIEGTSYLAITVDQARENLKLKADLKTAQKLVLIKDSEISLHAEEIAHYERTLTLKNTTLADKNEALSLKNEAIHQIRDIRDNYRELADLYRKVQNEKWFSISAGVGATSKSNPAALVGLGIKRFRVWAFAQESNTGVMAGVELPLF